MTSKTQEIFNCKCDEDVTIENPFKFIPKADILEDMKMRAAVCDFHVHKQQIIVSVAYMIIRILKYKDILI